MTEKKSSSLMSALKSGVDKLPSIPSLQQSLRQQVTTLNPSQHADTLQLQLTIKSVGAAVIDEDVLARELALFSKNLFHWSELEQGGADIVDVGDRLAFITFKTSELHAQHAQRVQQSRQALKDLRNFENDLVPRRKAREQLANKLASYAASHSVSNKTHADAIARMQSELDQLDQERETFEASLEALKRTKLHESFSILFAAQREFGEKQAILGAYGELLLQGMDSDGFAAAYKGHERTAAIKVKVNEALSAWSPSKPHIPTPTVELEGSSFLGRSDTGTFAQTHADALSKIGGDSSPFPSPSAASHPSPSATKPAPPPRVLAPIPKLAGESPITAPVADTATRYQLSDNPVPPPRPGLAGRTSSINLDPTPNDLGPNFTPPTSPHPTDPILDIDGLPSGPTVAETGVPIVGSHGPSSGQLPPRESPSQNIPPISLASIGGGVPVAGAGSFSSTDTTESLDHSRTSFSGPSGSRLPAHEGGEDDVAPAETLPGYSTGAETEEERAQREAYDILAREHEQKRA